MHRSDSSLNHLLRLVVDRRNGMCMRNRNFSKNHSVLVAASDFEVPLPRPRCHGQLRLIPPSH
jgi:hypothetical protein